MSSRIAQLNAWCRLLRVPNLPTVPGEPLAGFLLAGGAEEGGLSLLHVVPLTAASLLLYSAGLIWNDVADYAEDATTRASRPLVCGAIPLERARGWAARLAAIAVGLAALAGWWSALVGVALLGLVLLYDFMPRARRFWPGVVMGSCRGASLLLGASAAGVDGITHVPVLLAAGGTAVYVAGISWIAARELERTRTTWIGLVPTLTLTVVVAGLIARVGAGPLSVALAAVLIGWSLLQSKALLGRPEPAVVGRSIGGLIRGLLLLQAFYCAMAGPHGIAVAGCILLLWPLVVLLGRKFYAT